MEFLRMLFEFLIGCCSAREGGMGSGDFRISSDEVCRMGAKIKPPKILRASNKTPNNVWTKS